MQVQSLFSILKSRWASLRPGLRLSLFIAVCVATGGLLAWLDGISARAIVSMFLIMSVLTASGFAASMLLQRLRR